MIKTNKNNTTLALENQLRRNISKVGTFLCAEVTIGFGGTERVDMISIDTKEIIRCYEVKSSVADFNSKAKWTFIGHYNYFVLNSETFAKIKSKIPSHIGAYVDGEAKKRPKKQNISQSTVNTVKMSMIRSLSRDVDKLFKLENPRIIEQYESTIERLRRENYKLRNKK